MAALTQARNTSQYGIDTMPQLLSYPVAAGARLYQGGIAVLRAGHADRGQAGTDLVVIGRSEKTVDNSAGPAGATHVLVRQGVFLFANAPGTDAVTRAHVGLDGFVVDDQTIASSNAGGTRSRAGKIMDVAPDSVWILMGLGF